MDTYFNCRIEKAQALLLDCLEDFGITQVNAPSRLPIVPVFAVLHCTAAKRVNYAEKKLTPSTNDASVVFLELSGNIELPTKQC